MGNIKTQNVRITELTTLNISKSSLLNSIFVTLKIMSRISSIWYLWHCCYNNGILWSHRELLLDFLLLVCYFYKGICTCKLQIYLTNLAIYSLLKERRLLWKIVYATLESKCDFFLSLESLLTKIVITPPTDSLCNVICKFPCFFLASTVFQNLES